MFSVLTCYFEAHPANLPVVTVSFGYSFRSLVTSQVIFSFLPEPVLGFTYTLTCSLVYYFAVATASSQGTRYAQATCTSIRMLPLDIQTVLQSSSAV